MGKSHTRAGVGAMRGHTLAAKLRAARAQAGLTQRELAARIGCSRGSIADYETGRCEPDPARLAAIAAATGVPLGYFFPATPLLAGRAVHVLKPERALALMRGGRGQPRGGSWSMVWPGEWAERLGALMWIEVTPGSGLAASLPPGSVIAVLQGQVIAGARVVMVEGKELVVGEAVGTREEALVLAPDGAARPLRAVEVVGSVVVVIEPTAARLLANRRGQ